MSIRIISKRDWEFYMRKLLRWQNKVRLRNYSILIFSANDSSYQLVIDRNQSATKQERQTIAYQDDYKRETLTTKGNETVLSSQQTAVNNTRSSDSRTKSQPDMNASPAIENENKLFFRRTSMSFDSGEVGTLQRCKLELCNASNREVRND